jgi:predicted DNA-binding protein with PD1-like motif
MKWSTLAAGLLTAALVSAAAAQTVPDGYMAPSHPIEPGKAPGMKVQLLGTNGDQKTYAVIFSTGDEILSGLTAFAQQYHVTAAHFTAIGALSDAQLGWLDPAKKLYRIIPIASQAEVASMIGDIALFKGAPMVHTHLVASVSDGTTRAGHVLVAHVKPTLEVMVTVEPNAMHKRLNPDIGMTVIDPALQE